MEFLGYMITQYLDLRLLLIVSTTFLAAAALLMQRTKPSITLPPGPWCLPIVGYLPNLALHSRWFDTPTPAVLARLSQKYGSVFSLYIGDQLCVVLNDKEVIKKAFMNPYLNDRPIAAHVKDIQDVGILNASGANWKAQRAFTLGVFRRFGVGKDTFEDQVCSEIDYLLQLFEKSASTEFNPTPMVCTAISNIMSNITVAHRYTHASPDIRELLHLGDTIFKLAGEAGFRQIVKFLRSLPSKANQKLVTTKRQFMKIVDGQVSRRSKLYESGSIQCLLDVYYSKLQRTDSGLSCHINDSTIRQTIASLFIAGTDTTSFQIIWVIIFMLRYPDIKNKVIDEIDFVAGRERLPNLSDKARMPYTQAVVLEVMRMTTIIPTGVMHSASQDTTLCGYDIPKGTMIMSNLWWAHNDPEIWTEPSKFDPQRFLDNCGGVVGQDKIVSFSAGRRVCLGEGLAKMELFLFVTRLLHQFSLEIPEGSSAPSLDGIFALNYTPKPFTMTANKRV